MEKETFSQLELFSQGEDRSVSRSELPGALRGYLRHFEKAILSVIVFLITAIVAFCLGVEKGKKATDFSGGLQFDTASNRRGSISVPAIQPIPSQRRSVVLVSAAAMAAGNAARDKKKSPVATTVKGAAPADKGGAGFTIQVATYVTRSSAQNESAKLEKRGFAPVIVSKGGYNIICVGSFTKKEMAKSLLSKLRQNYRDCYIRRL
ncbi:MAG: SPOR domain-containing protein [Candidatus Omnitrophota bacterium]|jgi:hypothetical protein